MANKNPVAKFKKGNKYGKGQPPLPPEVREARKLNKNEFELAVSKIITYTVAELRVAAKAETTNAFEAVIARIFLKAIDNADQHTFNYFIERFLGKVAENHNFNGNLNTSVVDFVERIKAARKAGIPHGETNKESDQD